MVSGSSTKHCYSLKDLTRDAASAEGGYNATEGWSIAANHSTLNSACSTKPENFLIWTSRALDAYVDISASKLAKSGRKPSSYPITTAARKRRSSPVFAELKAQKPISPVSASPDFQKVCKLSTTGHALCPRSLGSAFSTAAGIARPSIARKPRRPQAFNQSRTMYP
jgi:hypothetical protein